MIKPICEQIQRLANDYDIIPVCKEVYADVVTPITLLRRIARQSSRYYLLESIEGGERWGRYSFLGFDPIARITCKDGAVTLENGSTQTIPQSPMEAIRALMRSYRAPRLDYMPPFAGGLVGYFSYEMISYAEPSLHLESSEFNDCDLMLFDKVVAYDHLRQKISVVVNMRTGNVMENYGKAVAEIERMLHLILDESPLPDARAKSVPHFTCNVSEEKYCEMVERAKAHIRAGDIFQAVISRRFETEYRDSLLNAYRVLRTTNPSPYMVFIQADDVQLISTSPETLVKLQEGRLSSFPVAGSRPRGASQEEDLALEKELLADEKELAEHNMLVDLARNDIGKIANFCSVAVTEYKLIHRYSRIMHITSVVEGDLKPGKDACDAIEALLPAGTLSGAPKLRACQIISELEPVPRGIYGGAIGYIDFSGNMDACIAIRMAVRKNDRVYIQAGAGIVADSDPASEYRESENKAKAVMEALAMASEVDN